MTMTVRCECNTFGHQGWCSHVNPEKKQHEFRQPVAHRVVRDRAFEAEFMARVTQYAEFLGVPDTAYTSLVFQRTDGAGAANYGDTSFLTDDRDLITEAREEAGDLGVYPMFHAEKRRAQGHQDDEVENHLALAAAHGAAADFHLRIASRLEAQA